MKKTGKKSPACIQYVGLAGITEECKQAVMRLLQYGDRDEQQSEHGTLWRNFPSVIPFAIIDSRITDLALRFYENPDKNLLTGYRRLEDIVRNRTGIDEHGVKLFSEAFHGDKAKLGWKGLGDNERIGRANLFTGAYMAYRNPRAHHELEHHAENQLMEFLLLNQLFVLEKNSIEREESVEQSSKKRGP
jgi:hypothetical protein